MDKNVKFLLGKLKNFSDFDRVKFIVHYGSQISGSANQDSDYDFAIYYEGDKNERFKFRLKLLSKLSDNFDIKIFQDLPLFVQKEILKGKIVYAKDLSFVYDIAYEIIKKFSHFKKIYYDYIKMEQISWWRL